MHDVAVGEQVAVGCKRKTAAGSGGVAAARALADRYIRNRGADAVNDRHDRARITVEEIRIARRRVCSRGRRADDRIALEQANIPVAF